MVHAIETNVSSWRRILVTGGCGFIGSHLVELLLHRNPNAELVILDSLNYAADQAFAQYVSCHPRVRFIQGCIIDRGAVSSAMAGVDVVFHLAAESHVTRSFNAHRLFHETNVIGTRSVVQAALAHAVPTFVHVSTDEVYGTTTERVDETAPFNPTSPYAISKANAEFEIASARRAGLNAHILRPSNAVGIRQHIEKVVPRFIEHMIESRPLPIEGSGLQTRTFVPVTDLVAAIALVAERAPENSTFNVEGREVLSVLKVAETVCRYFGRPLRLEQVADRPINDTSYMVDGTRLRNLGFVQQSSFEEQVGAVIRHRMNTRTAFRAAEVAV